MGEVVLFDQPSSDSYTSAGGEATITFDDLRWRIPWRMQIRYFIELVWTKGWAAVWQEGLWWRDMTVEVAYGR